MNVGEVGCEVGFGLMLQKCRGYRSFGVFDTDTAQLLDIGPARKDGEVLISSQSDVPIKLSLQQRGY
jgi:hypothetical protein